ncbi:uncharacterized protein [Nicotiana tomentosiformis]|uniref:uncharacterized protein n=1 Tax=Nicotiana tomentosiformis TaxID=4098 RepID=UPI00388CDDD3
MADDEQRRLERFERFRPPPFSGAESEDAQGFLDKCQRMLRIMGILETSGVSFTTFQFSGAAFRWWEQFSDLFLEKFVPQSCREELRRQFEQLCQGNMSVTQYEMIYSKLARHAIWLIPTDRENIRRFIDGLTFQLRLLMTKERMSGATFDEVVDIARQIEMVRSQERLIVVHQLATVLTVLTQASLHSVHYQRIVLIIPHLLRLLHVILRVIRSSSSVRGGAVSSAENWVISREIFLGY